ncbi:5449_t:CDS:1, partial [Gigaspora margarita]
ASIKFNEETFIKSNKETFVKFVKYVESIKAFIESIKSVEEAFIKSIEKH